MKKFCPMSLLTTVIITTVIAGGGVYYWQNTQQTQQPAVTVTQEKCPTVEPVVTETPKCDFTLSMDQKPAGESLITLQETYNEGAGFSLTFPSSWGFVNVTKHNLTDTSGETPLDELPQRAGYTFTSEFRPYTHYFTIIISQAKYKDNKLVTQGNRVYIAEDSKYYYNYDTSIQDCLAQDKCKEDEVEGINSEIEKIIDSFELLNKSNEQLAQGAQLANPASQNCVAKGGKLEMRNNKLGQYGVCLFEDNRQCEEWALVRGQCPEGGLKITGYENDAEIYCAITGGEAQGVGTETPMCKRTDGTLCTVQANLDRECPDPNDPNPNAGNVEI